MILPLPPLSGTDIAAPGHPVAFATMGGQQRRQEVQVSTFRCLITGACAAALCLNVVQPVGATAIPPAGTDGSDIAVWDPRQPTKDPLPTMPCGADARVTSIGARPPWPVLYLRWALARAWTPSAQGGAGQRRESRPPAGAVADPLPTRVPRFKPECRGVFCLGAE